MSIGESQNFCLFCPYFSASLSITLYPMSLIGKIQAFSDSFPGSVISNQVVANGKTTFLVHCLF